MLTDKFALQPLLPALLGLIFCLWQAVGHKASDCATAGCHLYADVHLAGLSLWWYGAGAFGLLSFFALAKQKRIGQILAGSALAVDTALLILLASTAPCTYCLLVGALFALTFLAFYMPCTGKKVTALFCLWLLFFSINLWAIAKSYIGPWAIVGNPKEASIHIYFSPNCPKCQEAVAFYAGDPEAAFYPVALKEGDVQAIQGMEEAIRHGIRLDEAMAHASQNTAWTWDTFKMAFRTLVNKAHIFLAGSSGIPYIEFRGLPTFVANEQKKGKQDEVFGCLDGKQESLPPELLGTKGQCFQTDCP